MKLNHILITIITLLLITGSFMAGYKYCHYRFYNSAIQEYYKDVIPDYVEEGENIKKKSKVKIWPFIDIETEE